MGAGYKMLGEAVLNALALMVGLVAGAVLAALAVLALVYWGV